MSPSLKDRSSDPQFAKEEPEAMGGPGGMGFGSRGTWDQLPALLLPSCVTLGRSLNLSVPQALSVKWDSSA